MKKLVTAFAACMIAGLVSAQVTSQNVVGYTTASTTAGNVYVLGINFDAVGSGTLTLSDLTGDFASGDTVSFVTFGLAGASFVTYTYFSAEDMGTAGWYDGDLALASTTVIPAGVALQATLASGGTITVAGQVKMSGGMISFPGASTSYAALNVPIPFNPNDVKFTWGNVSSGDTISVVDFTLAGAAFTTYTYFSAEDMGTAGWYDGDLAFVQSTICPVAKGFQVTVSGSSAATLTVASF